MDKLLNLIDTNQTVYRLLKDCPYSIFSKMIVTQFKPKHFFLNQGEHYDFVYIVVTGEIKIFVSEENGREILLDIYREGNFIGEQEAFLKTPYSASIENITECLVIKIPNKSFINWVHLDSNCNQRLIKSLCEQMYELTNRAAKYSLSTVKEQVITTILDLKRSRKIIDKKLLIQSVSATSRSVYRVLSELEYLGLIIVDAKTITIINEEKLMMERKKI